MDREAFEQLVSAWLDEPDRADIRARLDAAAAEDSEFARLREQSVRLDRSLREVAATPLPVAWSRLAARVGDAIDAAVGEDQTDAELDARLRARPALEARVDWSRFRARVSNAIGRPGAARQVWRHPRWRLSLAAGLLATAAALLLLLFTYAPTPSTKPIGPAGVAHVSVLAPGGTSAPAAALRPVARLVVLEESAVPTSQPGERNGAPEARSAEPEVYFMLEPPQGRLAAAPAVGPNAY